MSTDLIVALRIVDKQRKHPRLHNTREHIDVDVTCSGTSGCHLLLQPSIPLSLRYNHLTNGPNHFDENVGGGWSTGVFLWHLGFLLVLPSFLSALTALLSNTCLPVSWATMFWSLFLIPSDSCKDTIGSQAHPPPVQSFPIPPFNMAWISGNMPFLCIRMIPQEPSVFILWKYWRILPGSKIYFLFECYEFYTQFVF